MCELLKKASMRMTLCFAVTSKCCGAGIRPDVHLMMTLLSRLAVPPQQAYFALSLLALCPTLTWLEVDSMQRHVEESRSGRRAEEDAAFRSVSAEQDGDEQNDEGHGASRRSKRLRTTGGREGGSNVDGVIIAGGQDERRTRRLPAAAGAPTSMGAAARRRAALGGAAEGMDVNRDAVGDVQIGIHVSRLTPGVVSAIIMQLLQLTFQDLQDDYGSWSQCCSWIHLSFSAETKCSPHFHALGPLPRCVPRGRRFLSSTTWCLLWLRPSSTRSGNQLCRLDMVELLR